MIVFRGIFQKKDYMKSFEKIWNELFNICSTTKSNGIIFFSKGKEVSEEEYYKDCKFIQKKN